MSWRPARLDVVETRRAATKGVMLHPGYTRAHSSHSTWRRDMEMDGSGRFGLVSGLSFLIDSKQFNQSLLVMPGSERLPRRPQRLGLRYQWMGKWKKRKQKSGE